ncbi:MAG: L-threonylcarbamoyladenylate synthase [Flavobacteriaceae bacterium]|nr:L-threonylcarbamoyladenylate synthase [Flavobacteriaceae bacterium]
MHPEIEQSLKVLKRGGIILYPTDTVWGIGCDATNADAVDRIFALKQRDDSKALICLVSDFRMLEQYISTVPEIAYDILKYADRPTTIVYDQPRHVAENLVAADDSLGVRVTHDEFCRTLIKHLKKPLVSTSANISGEPTPGIFKEISQAILDGVDYVVNLDRNKRNDQPSSVIRLKNDGVVQVIRK